MSLARGAGHVLAFVDDVVAVEAVLRVNARAIIANLQDDAERQELARWTRYGKCPAVGDGLYAEALCQPDWELFLAFAVPKLFTWGPFEKFAVKRHVTSNGDVPTIAVLRGPFEHDSDALRAGHTLMRLWLEMADRGIAQQPFGSPLTNIQKRLELRRVLGIDSQPDDVWFLMRLGHAEPPPQAPRFESLELSDREDA
jgi:hypothetical protein